ncbi:hypothetical protein [Paenibacillus tengchongensis]|uniref:hypothetical protein n=1 Tax=Paenibacillus tengchongensis TaxID=2608684 RepID=UPI00124F1CBA|nr:hypothetical protein [Paenibacillus tengchongensis]
MQASIQPEFIWSQNRIYAGGAHHLILLVEWRGIAQHEESRRKSRKMVARDIELRIWLEAHVAYCGCYGAGAEMEKGGPLVLKLGKINAGQRKALALELAMDPMPAGIHEALWVQWHYRQPMVERVRELPLSKLSIEYTRHTEVLGTTDSFHVERTLELLKTEQALRETEQTGLAGACPGVLDKLRRQADKLLLLAARSGDLQLAKEAESLYRRLDAEQERRWTGSTSANSPFVLRT